MPAFAAIENGLGESDVCNACKNVSSLKQIDWNKRRELLVDLVAPYRTDSNYEVVIGVSGGKDSYFQTHFAIQELGLKPLLVTYHGNNYMPEAQENLDRMRKVFDFTFEPSARTYVCSPVKSVSLIVPVRTNVLTTSSGMLTSDAPLSTIKSSVSVLLMSTGTT